MKQTITCDTTSLAAEKHFEKGTLVYNGVYMVMVNDHQKGGSAFSGTVMAVPNPQSARKVGDFGVDWVSEWFWVYEGNYHVEQRKDV